MSYHHKQQGIGLISALFVIVIVGLFVLSALKLGPVYFENYRVKEALKSLSTQKLPARARGVPVEKSRTIQRILLRKFNIDSVTSVKMKDISVTSMSSGINVKVEYQVRRSFLGNIDFLVNFSEQVVLSR